MAHEVSIQAGVSAPGRRAKDIYDLFDRSGEDPAYYFFHIPKTAGTSLTSLLKGLFGPDNTCPARLWSQMLDIDPVQRDRYALYAGHFYTMLNCVVDRPLRSFVFLRDPVERAVSHYRHILRAPDHYLHALAHQSGTLERFLQQPVARHMFNDFQAKALVRRFDPIAIASTLPAAALRQAQLEKIIETQDVGLAGHELMNRAQKALDRFACVGITERFEESAWLLAKTFGWDFAGATPTENASTEKDEDHRVSQADLDRLASLNAVDVRLYRHAQGLLAKGLYQRRHPSVIPAKVFVSHAQNLEDVMLWRALRGVEEGFYIDVGAWKPDVDSVTKAFYQRGWRGINIEPDAQICATLEEARPRDVNLALAIGQRDGRTTFTAIPETGLSTLDPAIAARLVSDGWKAEKRDIKVTTLAKIWAQHVPPGQPVHFLKIDVEGLERSVLLGNDWRRFRPWVVVVEATLPGTQVECHADWEPILLKARYLLVYADGLNRFYVAEERRDLPWAFRYPPNVFDSYKKVSGEAEGKAVTSRTPHKPPINGLPREAALACIDLLRLAPNTTGIG